MYMYAYMIYFNDTTNMVNYERRAPPPPRGLPPPPQAPAPPRPTGLDLYTY